MYELLVLALLMHWPLHAYRLARIANQIIGPEEHVSPGTLSTLLARLERDDLIGPADPATVPFPADRPARAFALTDAGRARFRQLMLDTTSHPGTYRRLFHVKALHLDFLDPAQQLGLVEHYLAYCRQILEGEQEDRRSMAGHPLKQEHMSAGLRANATALIRLKLEQWQLELAWAQGLRDAVLARQAQSAFDPVAG